MSTLTKSYIDFAAVKSAVTIAQILEHYDLMDGLKPSGNGDNLRGCCPIHKGSDPTQFSVSLSKNCWNCFSDCQGGGNTLEFVARMEEIDVRDAALRINEWFDLHLDERPKNAPQRHTTRHTAPSSTPKPDSPKQEATIDKPEQSSKSDKPSANKPLGFELTKLESDHPYFEERGITPEAVAHFGLGFCKRGTLANRIAIPIHNSDGLLVGYAGRWPGQPPEQRPKYKLPTGFRKSAEVFNLHRALEEDGDHPLVLVEGFFDCIRLWQAGIERCAALMGSSLSTAQEELIRRATTRASHIDILFDEDDAGRKGRENVACRLARFAYVRIISLPKEGMQPDHLDEEDLVQLFE